MRSSRPRYWCCHDCFQLCANRSNFPRQNATFLSLSLALYLYLKQSRIVAEVALRAIMRLIEETLRHRSPLRILSRVIAGFYPGEASRDEA